MKNTPSPNFDGRKRKIDMLVIHYTGRPSLEESLAWLCDPSRKVSAHYCVAEDGEIFRLVEEKHRAWHAGESFWGGERDINSCSIGIEVQNPGHEFGYRAFPEKQIAALIDLSRDILIRHDIPAKRVLGHSDVAPLRKCDPGEKFPWELFAAKGVGVWPGELPAIQNTPDPVDFAGALANFGYDMSNPDKLEQIILAFQRHWRPENLSGKPDPETFRRLLALL